MTWTTCHSWSWGPERDTRSRTPARNVDIAGLVWGLWYSNWREHEKSRSKDSKRSWWSQHTSTSGLFGMIMLTQNWNYGELQHFSGESKHQRPQRDLNVVEPVTLKHVVDIMILTDTTLHIVYILQYITYNYIKAYWINYIWIPLGYYFLCTTISILGSITFGSSFQTADQKCQAQWWRHHVEEGFVLKFHLSDQSHSQLV